MALIQKAFSDIITFSRSSNATRIGPTGLVEYAPHNLILQSQTFDNASWTLVRATLSVNSTAAPDGTVTADKLIDSVDANSHFIQQSATIVNGSVYTASFYAKAGGRNWATIWVTNLGTSANTYFDLQNGVLGTIGTGVTATITSVGNGWYRCTVTGTSVSTSTIAYIGTATANNTNTAVGDGTSGIYLWGAQLAVGPYALDYTPTTSAAVYGPRFDFDPVTLAARGLLVEEQRTNLVNYSTVAFIGSQWQQYGSAVLTENYSVAPDGTITAGRILSSGFGTVRIGTSNLTNGTNYAASIWLKSNTGSNYSISLEIGDTLVGTFTVTPTWQRFSGVGTPFVTGYNFIDLETAATLDISVWGCQIEQGGFATSLIPTSGSTVTRSADVASVDTLSPWYNASAGTFYAEGSTNGFNAGRLLSLSDSPGSASTVQSINFETSGATRVYQVSGSLNFDFAPGAYTPQAIVKIAGRFNASNYAGVQNGGAVSTSSDSTTPPTMVYMALGALTSNSFYLNGHLRRVAYYPRALTNAEIQALTS